MKKTVRLIKTAAFTLALLLMLSVNMPFTLAAYENDADAQAVTTVQDAEEVSPVETFEEEVLTLVNLEREKAGIEPLVLMDDLNGIAAIRAEEASEKFSHTRPDGTRCFTVFKENAFTYKTAGENLAYGYDEPGSLVRAWMNSPTHRSNVLDTDFQYAAVGYYDNGHRVYCSLLFYTPKSA